MQAVEKDSTTTLDEISELEQDILGTSAQPQSTSTSDVGGSVATAKATVVGENVIEQVVLDGKILTSYDVQLMKKKLDDLILVNETKEKRLTEVRDKCWYISTCNYCT